MTRRAPGIVSLLLLLPLAACGGEEEPAETPDSAETSDPSDPSESSQSSEEPTDDADDAAEDGAGGAVQGDGYAFDGPEGWEDATDRFQAMTPSVDLGLLDTQGEDPRFADNVNILVGAPYPDFSADEAEQTFLEELQGFAKQAAVLPRTEIDDEDAVHLSGRTPVGKIEVFTEQYAAYVDDTWYILTFSHGPDTTAADREADMATVLDSWEWGAGDGA